MDEETGEAYAVLPIEFQAGSQADGCMARVPGIPAYGEGQTEEEAIFALMAALNGYMDAFGD